MCFLSVLPKQCPFHAATPNKANFEIQPQSRSAKRYGSSATQKPTLKVELQKKAHVGGQRSISHPQESGPILRMTSATAWSRPSLTWCTETTPRSAGTSGRWRCLLGLSFWRVPFWGWLKGETSIWLRLLFSAVGFKGNLSLLETFCFFFLFFFFFFSGDLRQMEGNQKETWEVVGSDEPK